MPGPIPKKEAGRRRRNKDGAEVLVINLDEVLAQEVEIPAPPTRLDDHGDSCAKGCTKHTGELEYIWHEIAVDAYLSLAASGQAIFMEPSDWATAVLLCEMISRELKPKPMIVQIGENQTDIQWVKQPLNGAVMNAFLKGWASLMATEGDRRRLKIELERKKRIDAALAGDGKVVSITQNRQDVFNRKARG